MERFLRDVWRLLVFLAEVVCAIVFGVPLGLILALFGGIAIYVFIFRMLGQELAAMWRKRVAEKVIAPCCVCGYVEGPCVQPSSICGIAAARRRDARLPAN